MILGALVFFYLYYLLLPDKLFSLYFLFFSMVVSEKVNIYLSVTVSIDLSTRLSRTVFSDGYAARFLKVNLVTKVKRKNIF